MRSILFTISLNWSFNTRVTLWVLWMTAGVAGWLLSRTKQGGKVVPGLVGPWLIVGAGLLILPQLVSRAPQLAAMGIHLPKDTPIFGFGLMLFMAFYASSMFAQWRFSQEGYDGEMAWDIAMWSMLAGVVGARVWHVIQYWNNFAAGPPGKLFALWDGGLVFYGGLIGGMLAFVAYCRARKLDPVVIADIVIPSLFIGMGFGRIGCFLNGCCFGDPCQVPWAVSFPVNSPPFIDQVKTGLLSVSATGSLPVHPTQLYSAFDAFIMAALAWAYYPYRTRVSDVVVLAWAGHAVTRFCLEFLRADEQGQFSTSLTISQWFSIGLLAAAGVFWGWTRFAYPPLKRQETVGQA